MRKLALVLVMICISMGNMTFAQQESATPILDRIRERGYLTCGVNASLVGFGSPSEDGTTYTGFDVEFCRAVAAAILGDAAAVEYVPLRADERENAMLTEIIDMLTRNTTFTLTRDTGWNAIFAPTTFYDGQGFMVYADSGITTLDQLDGASICVDIGTTTELNLEDVFSKRHLNYVPITYSGTLEFIPRYESGQCTAVTSDKSALVSLRFELSNPSAHFILEETISKEPLGPSSPQSDQRFAEIVRWTIYGLIQAEEFGITSQNIDEFLTSQDPAIQNFLGQTETPIGATLSLPNDFMVTVIRQVGNYGEIFDRHLTPLGLSRGMNNLWTRGGLLYSPPFR